MQSNEYHSPKIGQRLSLHGNKGTIRYIGEVQGTRGTWLGIEWDNPERGKHGGEKDGKQYFTCTVSGSGSFIRLSPAISYGQSFLAALISKYVELPHSNGQKETVILGSSNGTIEVEAIGLDKVRGKLSRLERLREISLDAEDVAYADAPPGEIKKTCPKVQSLDLSNSLLASWDQIALIAAELPNLRELSLNRNRFSKFSNVADLKHVFPALEELRLNETMITWSEVTLLISVMPKLRVLELGYNSMDQLGGGANTTISGIDVKLSATKLEVLNLDENKLNDWNDVMRSISSFKMLDRLILTANRLERIPQAPALHQIQSTTSASASALPNIKHLGIQDNLFSEWRDVDALNVWLPNLKTLNMSGNPLLLSRPSDFRQQVIARLPNLESLNGTAISIKERTDSEIYYISQIAKRNAQSQMSADEHDREFPRWKDLCAKHGAPDEQRNTAKARDTLADRLISIYVHYHRSDREPAESDLQSHTTAPSTRSATGTVSEARTSTTARLPPPSTLRVLPTMPIRLLRAKLLKSLNLPPARTLRKATNLTIYLMMDDNGLRKIEVKENESRDLAWWGIQDGSHILLSSTTYSQDHD